MPQGLKPSNHWSNFVGMTESHALIQSTKKEQPVETSKLGGERLRKRASIPTDGMNLAANAQWGSVQ
jgi:hypothetical protein